MNFEQVGQAIPLIEQIWKLGIGAVSTLILVGGSVWFLSQLKPLIENNTKAIEVLSKAMDTFGHVMTKTSDTMIAHDERSVSIQNDVNDLREKTDILVRDVAEIKGRINAN